MLLSAFDILLVPCVLVLIVCVCGFCNSYQLGDHRVEEVSAGHFVYYIIVCVCVCVCAHVCVCVCVPQWEKKLSSADCEQQRRRSAWASPQSD